MENNDKLFWVGIRMAILTIVDMIERYKLEMKDKDRTATKRKDSSDMI